MKCSCFNFPKTKRTAFQKEFERKKIYDVLTKPSNDLHKNKMNYRWKKTSLFHRRCRSWTKTSCLVPVMDFTRKPLRILVPKKKKKMVASFREALGEVKKNWWLLFMFYDEKIKNKQKILKNFLLRSGPPYSVNSF